MNRKAFIIPVAILFLSLYSSNNFSQTVGKIYSQDEANKLFGNVLETAIMDQNEFQAILSQTQNYIMIKVADGGLTILGDSRKVLYPEGKSVGTNDLFYVYSKSMVSKLLNRAAAATVNFEARQKTQTITSGTLTLEDALMCPPFCP